MATTADIFNKRYLVKTKDIALRTEEDIRLYGIRINDHQTINQTIDVNNTTCMLTINEMVEIYENGYPITIINTNDKLAILESIESYLKSWEMLVNSSVNTMDVPYGDLIRLDDFATNVFNISKALIIKKPHIDKSEQSKRLCLTLPPNPFESMGNPNTNKKINYDDLNRTPQSNTFKRRIGGQSINLLDNYAKDK